MKRLIYIVAVITLTVSSLQAQQLAQFSQFQQNQGVLNPAAVGAHDYLAVNLGTRYQWTGLSNDVQGSVAPRSIFVNGEYVLNSQGNSYNPSLKGRGKKNSTLGTGELKHSFGAQLVGDEYGAFRNTAFNGTYSIHLPINRKTNLSFGTRVGFTNHSFLQDKARVLSDLEGGGVVDQTYQSVLADGSSRTFLDISAGAYLYAELFFVGFAAHQLTRDIASVGSGITNFNPTTHFDVSGGVNIPINEDVKLSPMVLTKFMGPSRPVVLYSLLQIDYQDTFWGGIGYRHTDAMVGMAGMKLNNRFRIGYSFDLSLSRINTINSGGHELVLGVIF
jgi:type IX secretion system PorP/SprF family membrane protein